MLIIWDREKTVYLFLNPVAQKQGMDSAPIFQNASEFLLGWDRTWTLTAWNDYFLEISSEWKQLCRGVDLATWINNFS